MKFYYEDLLKEKSLDELLQESQVLQQKPLEVVVSDEAKVHSLVSESVNERIKEAVVCFDNKEISYETIKAMKGKMMYGAKCTAEYVGGLFHGFFETCFIASTMARRANEDSTSDDNIEYPNPFPKSSKSYNVGYFCGVILPFVPSVLTLGVLPIIGYYQLISRQPEIGWSLLETQITSNALSGLYEWFRYEKKKLKRKKKNGK